MRSISMFTGATRASPEQAAAAFDKTPTRAKIGLKTGRKKAALDHNVAGAAAVAISAT